MEDGITECGQGFRYLVEENAHTVGHSLILSALAFFVWISGREVIHLLRAGRQGDREAARDSLVLSGEARPWRKEGGAKGGVLFTKQLSRLLLMLLLLMSLLVRLLACACLCRSKATWGGVGK